MKLGIHKQLAAALGLTLLTALNGPANADSGKPALLQSIESHTIELSHEKKLTTRGEIFTSKAGRDFYCAINVSRKCLAKGSFNLGGKLVYYAQVKKTFAGVPYGKARFLSY